MGSAVNTKEVRRKQQESRCGVGLEVEKLRGLEV
jgi:hypothetical protein